MYIYIYIYIYAYIYTYTHIYGCIQSLDWTGLDWTTGLPVELEVCHYNSILVLICSLM